MAAPAEGVQPAAQTGPGIPSGHGAVSTPPAGDRIRVYVWQVPVRVSHWLLVGSIAVLSVTGGYIADPFLLPPGGSVMTTIRSIHLVAAFVFVGAGLLRTYWMFAGNRFAHWRAFVPATRIQLREIVEQLGWYLFVRRDAARVLGHNQLATASYMVVFFLFALQTATGFALAGANGTEPWATLFGWVPTVLFGIQGVRLIHHLIMWAILGFLVHHVYSCILVDLWEGNGLISSMVTGYKFVTRREILEARDGGVDTPGVEEPRA